MLRKSADTQLRSNLVVETLRGDGGTARGIDGFPDNPTICIEGDSFTHSAHFVKA